MSKVLRAYLRQTKRVPETLAKYRLNQTLDTEFGIIYPAFRGIEKEELLEDFNSVFADLKSFTATFHKSWEAIENTEQGKLWMQAVMHYFTTYGFENLEIDANGYVYLPEEISEAPELRKFKVIRRITNSETHTILEDILYHGNLGLKAQTIEDLLIMADDSGFELDINQIKNKEVKTRIAYEKHLIPSDTEDMIRLLNRVHTGKLDLIKDNEHFTAYWSHRLTEEEDKLLNMILSCRERQCSEVFNRFKSLFLSIRKRGYKKQINRISKLSKKYHKPLKTVEWLTTRILDGKKVNEATFDGFEINDLVKIYNSLRYTATVSTRSETYKNAYIIRNGKVFIKNKERTFNARNIANAINACETIKQIIKSRVDTDSYVVVPDHMEIAFPTSEKSFIGDIPLYTTIETEDANVVGISWNKNDIDLSAILKDGSKIGWNSNYKTKGHDVMYSGDMTRAVCINKECSNYLKQNGQSVGVCSDCGKPLWASEALYLGTDESVMIMSNLFNMDKSELNLYFANIDKSDFKSQDEDYSYNKRFIVDPNNILYSAKLNQETRSETLGVFFKEGEKNMFAFANLGIGNSNVSFGSEVMSDAIDVIQAKAETSLKLSDIYKTISEDDYNVMLDEIEDNYDDSEAQIEEIQYKTYSLLDLNKADILRLADDNVSLPETQ